MSDAPFKHIAFTFPMFGYGFDLDGIDYAIEEMASITDTVQINPIFQQKHILSNSFLLPGINPYPGKPNMTPPDSDIEFIIGKFADAGMKIELKIGANVADDTWSGLIDPSRPKVWFQNYGDLIVKWAAYAEQFGCERLIVTNEMWTLTSKYTKRWSSLIDRVRDVFDGKIGVNAVVTPDEARNISFAGDLDFIGLSFYAKLTDKTDPTVADLVKGWRSDVDGIDWVHRFTEIHEQYDLPIEISEIAFFGYDGAAASGNYANASGAVDQAEQRDQYEAFFSVLSNLPARWFDGVSFWRWIDTYPDRPWILADPFEGPTGSHIDGKPAEAVVREWLDGLRQTDGLDLQAVATGGVLDGGYHHDTLLGSGGNDEMFGGPGNDHLVGRLGNDKLIGETGRDSLSGGADGDFLFGGAGEDVLKGNGGNDVLRGGSERDILNGGSRNDKLLGEGSDDALIGGLGDDRLIGGGGDDFLNGGEGADALKSGKGHDVLKGGEGDDRLIGGGGDDRLIGGDGDDILNGGKGADVLKGGRGQDVFEFRSTREASTSKSDTVSDFKAKHGDLIDLSGIDAMTGKGNQAFDFIGEDAFSGAKGELRFDAGSKKLLIQCDLDGDGTTDFAVEVARLTSLTADDFIL